MSYSHDRMLGHRDGVRAAITWLHARAREMNDPNAKTILNTAAFNLGVDLHAHPATLETLGIAKAEPVVGTHEGLTK